MSCRDDGTFEVHRVLERQLQRLGLSISDPPPDLGTWAALLERISNAYSDADQERYLLERSLTISSAEMQDLYAQLERSVERGAREAAG